MKNKIPLVLFVCEHGSAKSTIAAEYFNKIAHERNLQILAISRGTDPDSMFPPNVTTGLAADGLKIHEPKPKKLRQAEISQAVRIVSFCQIPSQYVKDSDFEDWSNVPPVSENYGKSRDEIVRRVKCILNELEEN